MVNISLDFNLFNSHYYLYERLLVILCSLIPAIILIGFVLYSDRKSSEPVKNIAICLISGILTIALSQYLEKLVMPYIGNNFLLTYVWATIEEASKFAIFLLFIFDNKYYDDIYDGIVYMSLIALSFAGLENIMYAFSESTVSNSIRLALMRDFTTIPLHVICGVMIGYFISLSNFSKDKNKKTLNFALAIIIPAFIHGTYNTLMNFFSNIKIDYTNTALIMFLIALPLVIIMTVLIMLAFKTIKKCTNLNDIFVSNGIYDEKHSYLMIKDEYDESAQRKNRNKNHSILTFGKEDIKW